MTPDPSGDDRSDRSDGASSTAIPDGGTGPPWRLLAVLVVLVAVVAWLVRPWLHGVVYALYTTPMMVLPIALGLLAGWLYARTDADVQVDGVELGGQSGEQLTPFRVAVGVFIVVGVAVAPVANLVAGATLSDQTMSKTTHVNALHDVDASKPRIVPRAVASRYASNTLNRPQYRAADTDITVVNGTPYWAAPLAPDGLFNVLTKKQGGTVLVDMTTQQANVRTVDGELAQGVGTVFLHNYKWHLLTHGEYLVDYGDPKMVVHDGEQYIMVPYSKPTFHLTPIPHTTPKWAGVALIDASGSIRMLSPAEAEDSPVLQGQQLYPEKLARRKVAATKYRNGILNTFTSHEDEIEVAPVPGENNDQPFFVLSEDGPQYVVAVEPYGNAQGLREVWTIDGRTGRFEVYRPTESLFGPQKAADLVRQSAPQTDWNRFNPAEPILTVIDGRPYWQVRVVPEDNSGIAYVAFVNARTSDVRQFSRTDAITAFLAGRTPVNRTTGRTGNRSAGAGGPTVVVQRVNENGTVVETMRVYANESIRIRTNATRTGTSNASTGTTAGAGQ